MKAQGRADACGMFTEPSGPLMAIPATKVRLRSDARRAAPKEQALGLYSPERLRFRASCRQNELGFGTEFAKTVPSFRVVGTPVVRPVRKAKGLSETAWLQ